MKIFNNKSDRGQSVRKNQNNKRIYLRKCLFYFENYSISIYAKKGKRKVQGVPQSQTAALPRHQEEEETDKSKQAQIEQMYENH